jgi:hypothetical protein
MMSWKLEDYVTWTSQANAYTKTKRGCIVGIVPADQLPKLNYINLPFHLGTVMPRNHESYIVAVKSGRFARKLYWPRVSALERCK